MAWFEVPRQRTPLSPRGVQGHECSGRRSEKLNTFAHPTVSFACSFAHKPSEYAKKTVGLLYSYGCSREYTSVNSCIRCCKFIQLPSPMAALWSLLMYLLSNAVISSDKAGGSANHHNGPTEDRNVMIVVVVIGVSQSCTF